MNIRAGTVILDGLQIKCLKNWGCQLSPSSLSHVLVLIVLTAGPHTVLLPIITAVGPGQYKIHKLGENIHQLDVNRKRGEKLGQKAVSSLLVLDNKIMDHHYETCYYI